MATQLPLLGVARSKPSILMRIVIISYRHEGIVMCTVSANNCIDPQLKHWHKVRFKNSYAKT